MKFLILFTVLLLTLFVSLPAQTSDPSIRDTALYKQLAEYMPLLLEDRGLGTNSFARFGTVTVGLPGGGAALYINANAEAEFTGPINVDSIAFNGNPATTRANMGLGWPALTNSNSATHLLGYFHGGLGTNHYHVVSPPWLRFTNWVEISQLFIGLEIEFEEGPDGIAATNTRANLGLGGGITTNKTFIFNSGTNLVTNTITISNGIIKGWTP
jgi:hypothetical protein